VILDGEFFLRPRALSEAVDDPDAAGFQPGLKSSELVGLDL